MSNDLETRAPRQSSTVLDSYMGEFSVPSPEVVVTR